MIPYFMGILGRAKTLAHIQSQIYWPNIVTDVTEYVRLCHVFQKTERTGIAQHVPIQEFFMPFQPFQKNRSCFGRRILPSFGRRHIYPLHGGFMLALG